MLMDILAFYTDIFMIYFFVLHFLTNHLSNAIIFSSLTSVTYAANTEALVVLLQLNEIS